MLVLVLCFICILKNDLGGGNMVHVYKWILLGLSFFLLQACGGEEERSATSNPTNSFQLTTKQDLLIRNKEEMTALFNEKPTEWGEQVTGVKTHLDTDEKNIALTFDACGGPYGNQVDEALIIFLQSSETAATIFVNKQWMEENENTFLELAKDPLFEIENHGSEHKPLSVDGSEAWGIEGTTSPEEVYDEIMKNDQKVKEIADIDMNFFRSGTAFYDELAIEIANELGYDIVNFDILGDAGATYSSEEVEDALLQANPGSIALLHMNQPESGTAKGVEKAVPQLKEKGYHFVHLTDYPLE